MIEKRPQFPQSTNYASTHNAPGELWQRCKELEAEIERLKKARDDARAAAVYYRSAWVVKAIGHGMQPSAMELAKFPWLEKMVVDNEVVEGVNDGQE